MTLAYIDTSCLVAVAFSERGAGAMTTRLRRFDRLLSSNLLEAELRSALVREGVGGTGRDLLSWVTWVYPNRPLTPEFDRILGAGYVKGADLWHLATALFLSPSGAGLSFLTLDSRQGEVATSFGFIS